MSYQTIWEAQGVYLRIQGRSDEHEISRLRWECQHDLRFQDIRYLLIDLQECEDFAVSLTHMKEMAISDAVAKMLNETLSIVIVTGSRHFRELAKHYGNLGMDNYRIQVFAEIGDARRWLDIESAAL